MKPPSHTQLLMDRPIVDLNSGEHVSSLGPKCDHKHKNSGKWVVAWEGKFYPLVYGTQLQKDIWLSATRSEKEKNRRMNLLRWYCFTCSNVQEP